jgi:predicted ATP-grasp superfamily ATP-dependent carboligase
MKHTPPVFILSIFDTGLYAAQLLGMHGIPVFGFDHDLSNPGFYSKYITAHQIAHPATNGPEIISYLIARAKDFTEKPILIAASEIYLNLIYENRIEIERNFIITLPAQGLLSQIIDKARQFTLAEKIGEYVPKYWEISTLSDLECLLATEVEFPLIIKAGSQAKWKSLKLSKAYVVYDKIELQHICNDLLSKQLSYVVQQIIQGSVGNNYEYNSLMIDGVIIESSVIRKIRQYPFQYGAATCIETTVNNQVEKLGRDFVLKNGIEGFSNTEFKFNPQDGRYYFIETNARVWQQIKLTTSINQNFMISYYQRFYDLGIKFSPINKTKTVKWVDLFSDILSLKRSGDTNLKNWFNFAKSYYNVKHFGLLTLRDINPFFASLKR